MSKRAHVIEAYFRRAVQQQLAGRVREASHMYREILATAPRHGDSLHMLGVLALQTGHPTIALEHIDRAIGTNRGNATYHLNRANALRHLGRMQDALAACRESLRLNPANAEAHQTHGHILSDLGQVDRAVSAYQEAVRRNPALFDIHNNLGVALRHVGRLEDAEHSLREALRREPDEPGVIGNLANVLKELARLPEAETCLRDGLRRQPNNAALRYNLSLLLLLAGSFEEGWAFYEARSQTPAVAARPFQQPIWQGEDLAGRTLLVHTEQGLGDTIQFCRYVPLLQQRIAAGGKILFEVPAPLSRLLTSLSGPHETLRNGEPLPVFDLVCPLLSLPERFGTTSETIPTTTPYLHAEPERVEHWWSRLGRHGFKIGINWQGNPSSQAELGRSIPLHQFEPVSRIPGVRLISLQKGYGLEELTRAPLPFVVEQLGEAFDNGPDAFVDTAAVMAGLDLIITSDTAVAHLAGALARPTWVGLQHVPDWRWMMRPATSSPWYPTMRLFRQTRRGDWDGVFAQMAAKLPRQIDALSVSGEMPRG